MKHKKRSTRRASDPNDQITEEDHSRDNNSHQEKHGRSTTDNREGGKSNDYVQTAQEQCDKPGVAKNAGGQSAAQKGNTNSTATTNPTISKFDP